VLHGWQPEFDISGTVDAAEHELLVVLLGAHFERVERVLVGLVREVEDRVSAEDAAHTLEREQTGVGCVEGLPREVLHLIALH